jgi:hypothetical protein
MIIVTRQKAKELGLKRYFTGLPCKYGHISERTISSGCAECSKYNSKKYHKKNRKQCLVKMKERNGAYYQKNSEKIKTQAIKYQKENSKERTAYKKEWAKEKAKNNPEFKMGLICRRMLQRALGLSGQKKYKRTFDYLKYSSDDLVNHLESQFKDGMNWGNYGEWHIDHITPISYLIKNKIIDPAIINALTNLQPLWASENMSKGCKTNLITGL